MSTMSTYVIRTFTSCKLPPHPLDKKRFIHPLGNMFIVFNVTDAEKDTINDPNIKLIYESKNMRG